MGNKEAKENKKIVSFSKLKEIKAKIKIIKMVATGELKIKIKKMVGKSAKQKSFQSDIIANPIKTPIPLPPPPFKKTDQL